MSPPKSSDGAVCPPGVGAFPPRFACGYRCLIGIDDDGNAVGIETDYETLKKKEPPSLARLLVVKQINITLIDELAIPNLLRQFLQDP